MLRITAQSDASAACRYFQAGAAKDTRPGHDYHLEGHELTGQWGGQGAALFGLSGDVAEIDFRALAFNRDPRAYRADPLTGAKVTPLDNASRRVGHDCTFSVPKSVTLAYELLQDDRILTAFRDSVAETMADIEADAIIRDQRGGETRHHKPGNLTHATFVHRSSRPVNGVPDCQLHAHVFVFNMARHRGRWTAVELGEVKANAPYYEAVAMARLGKKLVDLGYGVRRKGRFFELEGVSDELVDKFSTRRNLIDKLAEERGITDPAYKAELGGKTREHKLTGPRSSPGELRAGWIDRLTDAERHALTHLPGQRSRLPSARESAAYAISHAFEREAVVPEKRVIEHALRHGVGSVDVASVRWELQSQGLIVRGDRATTREMLAVEAGMVRWAAEGRGVVRPVSSTGLRSRSTGLAASPLGLNAGQQAAVHHVLRSKDRVTLVRGAAGVGKTTALEVAAAAIRDAGLPVQAVAIGSKAVEELAGVDDNAATIARFLIDTRMQDRLRGGVMIVDEAGQLGTRDAAKLFGILDRVGARAVMVGDVKQHEAVAAGSPFRLLQEHAGLPVAEITEVMRQRGDYKRVSEHLGRHDTEAALDLLNEMGHVHECDHAERVGRIAEDYAAAVKRKQSVLVVAPTHAEADQVTAAIRDRLKQDGKLKHDDRTFTRLVPLHLTEAEKSDPAAQLGGDGELVAKFHRSSGVFKSGLSYDAAQLPHALPPPGQPVTGSAFSVYRQRSIGLSVGDSVRVTAGGRSKDGRHKLKTGSVYQVKGFTRLGDIQLDNGWVLDKDFGHLAHGYVSTSHASQGRTVDVVLVSESRASFPAAGAEQLYVSISRGKQAAHIYTDNVPALREAVARSRAKENASDLVELKPARRPLKQRAQFISRLGQLRDKVAESVSKLTSKEKQYGREAMDRG